MVLPLVSIRKLTLEADPDGIVRRAPLVAIHRGTLVPSLNLEAVRLATDAGNPDLTTSDGTGETLAAPGAAVSVRLGDTVHEGEPLYRLHARFEADLDFARRMALQDSAVAIGAEGELPAEFVGGGDLS